MEIHVRKARPADVDFARSLYFETMRGMIETALGWDQARQEERFAEWFVLEDAGIIMADGREAGWLQTRTDEHEVSLGSLYLEPEMQRHGIGTRIVRDLIVHCRESSKVLTLSVMKINPAVRLYERLGFRITHQDEFKFYMQAVDAGIPDSVTNSE